MKNGKPQTISYTIEREFLGKVSVAEFVNHIIQNHVKNQSVKEVVSP